VSAVGLRPLTGAHFPWRIVSRQTRHGEETETTASQNLFSWPVVRLLLHVWGKDFIRREILSGKCSTWRPQETGKLGARGEHFPQDVSRRTRQRPGHFLSFLAKHKKKEVGKSRSQALPDIILSQSLSFSLSKEEKEEIVGRHYVPGETLLGPTKGKRNRRRAKRCFHQERQIPFDSHFFLSI